VVSYREALKRLEAYPRQRLAYGEYVAGRDRCALGVILGRLAREAQRTPSCAPTAGAGELFDHGGGPARALRRLGITRGEACAIQSANDGDPAEEPGDRYARVLRTVRRWAQEETDHVDG
jgi:hypothetical protein